MVRKEIEDIVEDKFNCVEEAMKREAIDIIKNVCCRLVQTYQQHKKDPDSGASPASSPPSSNRSSPERYLDVPNTHAQAAVVETLETAPEQLLDPEQLDFFSGNLQLDDLLSGMSGNNQGYGDITYW
jgi:hypothetical protein